MSEYSETQQKILEIGKREFLKNGFEHSSLREIVKKAGFTKGAFYGYYPNKVSLFYALVEPVAEEFIKSFKTAQEQYFTLIPKDETYKTPELTTEYLRNFIEYIYEHLDEFKLILCCSNGTKYENFVHDLVQLQVGRTIEYHDELRKLGKLKDTIDPVVFHMLISAYYEGLFEVIRHDIKKEDALNYIEQISTFFTAGFNRLISYL